MFREMPVKSFHINGKQEIGRYFSTVLPLVLSFWHKTVRPPIRFPFKILFNWKVVRSCKFVNFLILKTWTPSLPGTFQLGIFLLCLETISLVITRHSCLWQLFSTFSFLDTLHFYYVLYFHSIWHSKILAFDLHQLFYYFLWFFHSAWQIVFSDQ